MQNILIFIKNNWIKNIKAIMENNDVKYIIVNINNETENAKEKYWV